MYCQVTISPKSPLYIYMEVFLLCPLYEMSIRDALLLLFLKVSYVIHFRPISIARELYLTSLKQNS